MGREAGIVMFFCVVLILCEKFLPFCLFVCLFCYLKVNDIVTRIGIWAVDDRKGHQLYSHHSHKPYFYQDQ